MATICTHCGEAIQPNGTCTSLSFSGQFAQTDGPHYRSFTIIMCVPCTEKFVAFVDRRPAGDHLREKDQCSRLQ